MFNKLNLFHKNRDEDSNSDKSLKNLIFSKFNSFTSFFSNQVKSAFGEYKLIRKKMKDLSSTNYNLGMKHLDSGNVSEATFRFKITKKFWPNNYDAYYQLIYCFILSNKIEKAKVVAKELLIKKPNYKDKVEKLLSNYDDNKV